MDAGAARTEDAAVARDSATRDAAVDERASLRATIRALEGLIEGRLASDVDPQTLFEVDLLDEVATAQRVAALRGPGTADRQDAGVDASVSEAVDAGEADAGLADASDSGAGSHAVIHLAGLPDASLPDAAIFDGGVADTSDASTIVIIGAISANTDDLDALRANRDRLRLRFLTLPTPERTAVIEAVRARRRFAVEERASRVDAERASADARRASEARDDLLSRAETADAIESALLAEHARMEAIRGELARWEVRAARRREATARENALRLERIHQLESSIETLESDAADEEYDAVVEELAEDRRTLDAALDGLGEPSGVPRFELNVDLDIRPYRDPPAAARLREAVERFGDDRAQAEAAEERFRWAAMERLADDIRALDQLRVRLLDRMSRLRRETVLGLGAEGRAQAGRELEQIRLLARYWLRRSWHDAPSAPRAVGGLFLRSSTRTELTWVLLLAILIVSGWRQREWITQRLRESVHARGGGTRWRAILRPFWPVLGPLVVPLAAVAALHVVFWLLDDLSNSLMIDGLEVVVLRVAWFFVAMTAVARFFVSRLRHGASRAATARRVFGSVRLVMGFGLVVALMIDLSELLVGHGYLYEVIVDLAWFGALPIALLLTHQWSAEVCAIHRERHPESYVARVLDAKDSRARRWLLTPAAATQLAFSGSVAAMKELALRFDQLRSAFAFLFRRRLERRVEGALDETDVDRLSADLRGAFSELPSSRELEIDFFPGLDDVVERIEAFLDEGAPGFALALVGERGIGKTTWLRELTARTGARPQTLDVPHRLTEARDVCHWLSDQLGLPRENSVAELSDAIEGLGEPRVLLLDHCQNLIVRAIGGTSGLETLLELAARTSRHVVWVCSFSRYTWLYLERARQGQDLFREHVELAPWSEERISELVHRRMDSIDQKASFRDLVVDSLAGSALEDAVLRTEGEYLRLLWDFAQGNPRVALHFWKHSLQQAEDDSLAVRLFAAPDISELDSLHEQSRFLLATIALHENATVAEAAASAGSSPRECSALLAYLSSSGYVRCDDEGHWRLSTHWYRGVIRFLRRQRLLFD